MITKEQKACIRQQWKANIEQFQLLIRAAKTVGEERELEKLYVEFERSARKLLKASLDMIEKRSVIDMTKESALKRLNDELKKATEKQAIQNVMTTNHPEWEHFCGLLSGKEGCNFKKDEKKRTTWRCAGGNDKSLATAILKTHFPNIDIKKSMAYFEKHGGFCDCEILFNVDARR